MPKEYSVCHRTGFCKAHEVKCYCEEYDEALSKAPTWEIKNGEEIERILMKEYFIGKSTVGNGDRRKPEQGKLYDLPKGYTYIIENVVAKSDSGGIYKLDKQVAILIPQEEMKGEGKIFDEVIQFAVWYSGMNREKVIIAHERWKKEVNPYLTRR